MSRPSSKESILDAAETIVVESGALHMTLDAVAERAGVSKGGLIYHFPSKEALLQAMVDRMVDHFDASRERLRANGCPNDLVAEIKLLQNKTGEENRMGAALLAAIANQPELTKNMRERLREHYYANIFSEDDFNRSAVIVFAALGLHFHDLLQMSLLEPGKKDELYETLLKLANNGESSL